MTEERFRNMENLLNMLFDSHVQFHSEMQELKEAQIRQAGEIGEHRAAIRDLIVVSRTVLDSIMQLRSDTDKLREAQEVTDKKLQALIETVDRIVRKPNA
jgi:hypothetical protein